MEHFFRNFSFKGCASLSGRSSFKFLTGCYKSPSAQSTKKASFLEMAFPIKQILSQVYFTMQLPNNSVDTNERQARVIMKMSSKEEQEFNFATSRGLAWIPFPRLHLLKDPTTPKDGRPGLR